MKYLQRLFVLLIASATIIACQKEYSIEVPAGSVTSATSQWEFKEGGVQFKGPIDSVAIDTILTYTFLTINGRSDDGSSLFTLQAFGSSIKQGSYKTPFSLLAYGKGTSPIYQTDQSATDSFTIVITKFDSTGIAGTFSGLAKTGTVSKTITEGKFTAPLKKKTPTTPPATTDSGQVVLWSKGGCGGTTNPISVSVGTKSGQITQFLTSEPTTCDPAGSFSIKLPVGTYPVVAKCGTDSFSTTITIQKNTCTKVQIDVSGVVASTDYFPTTKSSNWSYLYEAATPADTLYTLSTGSTKTMLGNSYSLFTNTDGAGKDTTYYRKSGNTYYEYIAANTSTDTATGLTISLPAFEYRFLVDNLATNATFSNGPYTGTASLGGVSAPFSASNKTTVLATGVSVTVSGTAYTNVIKVKTIYSSTFSGTTNDIYGVEQWFAKGVGLIKYIDYETAPFTTPTYVLNITRAKVY